MISKRILITGGKSRFAKNIEKVFKRKKMLYTHQEMSFDILNPRSIENCIKKYKPNYLIHLASLSRPMDIHQKNKFKILIQI